jgi:colanic acid/amylovoran biosynthesis glycosyltransferase
LGVSPPPIAYILLWFPHPTQTFILDEVNTQVDLGADIRVYTLYGPCSPRLVAGMAPVRAPVHRLGLASLPFLGRELLRARREWGPRLGQVLRQVLLRPWRTLETAGEALWAALAGVHLARRFPADGIRHIHAPWADGPATAAWVASRLSGIPFSFCGHAYDLYPPDGALAEKMAAAACIRTISRANVAHLKAVAPAAGEKIIHIPYGVPLKGRPLPPPPVADPGRLLAIGRFVETKGFPYLLEAVHLLRQRGRAVHLTLAGDGWQRRRLERLIRRYRFQDRVHLPGFVRHQEVPHLLARAQVFVMPSVVRKNGDRDGIPNVILEALLHEVPVVATAVNGIPEVIRPGDTGWLVPPRDPRALAAAIDEALSHPEAARRLARRGRELVRERFDSYKNYGRLKDCLEAAALNFRP